MKIKKGDNVIVIVGKHKGAKGKVGKIVGERVLVDGVNKIKHHIKARSKTEKGSIVEKEATIHGSNVMLVDGKSGKGTRIGKKKIGEKMVRFAKKSGDELK
jgi:large subunit ribosomal protein L24